MLTLYLFILFALCLAFAGDYLRPYAPLLQPVPICGCCGARRWRVTT